MHTLEIYGIEDRLIQCDGEGLASHDQFEVKGDDYRAGAQKGPAWLSISDGTLLGVEYDNDCVWRFKTIVQGMGTSFGKVEGTVKPDTESDRVTLTSEVPFQWVLLGRNLLR